MCVSPGGCARDRLLACGLIGSTMARGVSGTRRQSAQSGFINRHACMHIFSNTDVNKDLNPLKLFALEIENTGAWRVRNPAADRPPVPWVSLGSVPIPKVLLDRGTPNFTPGTWR